MSRSFNMLPLARLVPALPGFPAPKTYAAWPVWRDSTTAEVKFQPLKKKEAAKRWHKAKRFDLQTHTAGKHGGAIGPAALEVLRVMLFEFLDYASGQLDPSYETIAAKAGLCVRTVADALKRLRDLGLLHWQRRARPEPEASGGFRLVQETNAYAVLSPANWRGYYEPPPAPAPQPGTWGDHPPRDLMAEAAEDCRAGSTKAAIATLNAAGAYGGDPLAAALARFGQALFGPKA